MVAGDVKIPSPTETFRVSCPAESGGPFPVVLIAYEVFGLQEHIKDLPPFRQGRISGDRSGSLLPARDVSKLENFDEIFKIVSKVRMRRSCRTWMRHRVGCQEHGRRPKTWSHRILLGGRIAWLYAAHSRKLKPALRGMDAGRRHGGAAAEKSDRHRADAQKLCAGSLRRQDQGIPLDTVEKMREALKKAGTVRNHRLSGRAARFFCRYPSELSQGSRRRWLERLLAWFKKYGAA